MKWNSYIIQCKKRQQLKLQQLKVKIKIYTWKTNERIKDKQQTGNALGMDKLYQAYMENFLANFR